MAVTLRKNNRSPSLYDTIRQLGVATDLTGATVKLQARTEAVATLVIDTAETIITASTTLSAQTVLPEPAITVAATTGFIPHGALNVGSQIVEYDEISGNTFLGCRGGEGTIAASAAVSQRGGVRYDWAAADVDEVAEFIAWHRVVFPSTLVQETPTFQIFVEDPTLVSQGLCELSDVLAYARGYRSDEETDALLLRNVLAKSRLIQRETGREFRAISPVVGTRRFDLALWNVRERKVRIGDLSTSVGLVVKVIDSDQTTEVETVSSANYVLLPRTRQAWEPITGLFFPPSSAAAASLTVGDLVEVAGTWGFPSVPDDLREACAGLVVVEYVSNPALAGTAFAEALGEVNIGALFAGGRRVVQSYALPLVA